MYIPTNRLSSFIVAISSSAFVAGLIGGAVSYVGRSHDLEKYVSGSNAIPAHIVVILVALILLAFVIRRHQRAPKGTLMLLAPFSKSAYTRFRKTLLMNDGVSLTKIMRAILSLLLGIFYLFFFWRAGLQVIGGLDPNFVTNAWGGPTYIGASLIHWLDGLLLFYLGAFLLNLVMVKKTSQT